MTNYGVAVITLNSHLSKNPVTIQFRAITKHTIYINYMHTIVAILGLYYILLITHYNYVYALNNLMSHTLITTTHTIHFSSGRSCPTHFIHLAISSRLNCPCIFSSTIKTY